MCLYHCMIWQRIRKKMQELPVRKTQKTEKTKNGKSPRKKDKCVWEDYKKVTYFRVFY